jgi:hypothetical protein
VNGKLTLRCTAFRRLCKGSLRGFATVEIVEMCIVVNDVGVHQRGDRAWVGLPGRPWIRDGALVTGEDGRINYSPVIEFTDAKVFRAFSDRAIAEILKFEPTALICDGGAL